MSKKEDATQHSSAAALINDDEPDEWDKRIFSTGCAGMSMEGDEWKIRRPMGELSPYYHNCGLALTSLPTPNR
ncbi:hypothetical protein F4861DRAFT_516361 [Xylaria intraflava]|nr:hypothetical protein F4861DRAFT_516361 [Xylaria intraflava]